MEAPDALKPTEEFTLDEVVGLVSLKKKKKIYFPCDILEQYFFLSFFCSFLMGSCLCMQGIEVEGELPEMITCYSGVFYNYFSIGNLIFVLIEIAFSLQMQSFHAWYGNLLDASDETLYIILDILRVSCLFYRNGCSSGLWLPSSTE